MGILYGISHGIGDRIPSGAGYATGSGTGCATGYGTRYGMQTDGGPGSITSTTGAFHVPGSGHGGDTPPSYA